MHVYTEAIHSDLYNQVILFDDYGTSEIVENFHFPTSYNLQGPFPNTDVVGVCNKRGNFFCRKICHNISSVTNQLSLLKSWNLPVNPYIVVVKPSILDLIYYLHERQLVDVCCKGLYIVCWKSHRESTLCGKLPICIVTFFVVHIRWISQKDGRFHVRLHIQCNYRRMMHINSFECDAIDIIRFNISSYCYIKIGCVDGKPLVIVSVDFPNKAKHEKRKRNFPWNAVIKNNQVFNSLFFEKEVQHFFSSLGIVIPKQCIRALNKHGVLTIHDFLTTSVHDLMYATENDGIRCQIADFVQVRPVISSLDNATLLSASGKFNCISKMKLSLICNHFSSLCELDIKNLDKTLVVPGITSSDVEYLKDNWEEYEQFLCNHSIDNLYLEFKPLVEWIPQFPDIPYKNKKKKRSLSETTRYYFCPKQLPMIDDNLMHSL